MAAEQPLTRVGPFLVVMPIGVPGAELLVACEDEPGAVPELVLLEVALRGTASFDSGAEDLALKAAAGARLDHPHVLRTLRCFAGPFGRALVVEHLGGATLGELLEAARISGVRWSDDAILFLGAAACHAMGYAHARGQAAEAVPIGHGRFGPNAVHLGPDGAVKVAGFAQVAGTADADRLAVGRLLWELLASRPSSTHDLTLSAVRDDLAPEVVALVDAACAPEGTSLTFDQLGAWLEKATSPSAAREEIARRVVAHVASRPAVAPTVMVPERGRRSTPTLGRVGMIAATLAVISASFAVGRLSRPAVAVSPRQAMFAAEAEPSSSTAGAMPAQAASPVASVDVSTAAEPDGGAPAVDLGKGAQAEASDEPAERSPGARGWLTVHSPVRSGSVYVHELRTGGVDETISVPCGKRLVSLGIANPKHPEPTWLAPAQFIRVPCGGAVETTIVPRVVKRRSR